MTVYRITSDDNIIRVASRNPIIKIIENTRGATGAPGVIQSIIAGDNITVDNTNVANPIIASTSDVTSVDGQTGAVTLDYVAKSGDTMYGDLSLGSNDLIDISSLQMATAPTIPTYSEGNIYWDELDHTLSIQQGIGDTTLQVGQEMYVRARNSTGSTIANGQVVYISGATGNRPNVMLAQANNQATSSIIGMATHDIQNNTDGIITTFGKINDLNTSAYTEGATLYLSSTVAGGVTTTMPSLPNQQVIVGTVVRSHVTLGSILFRSQNIPQVRVVSVPATTNSTGSSGTIAFDTTYLYICVATNTWRRVSISSW